MSTAQANHVKEKQNELCHTNHVKEKLYEHCQPIPKHVPKQIHVHKEEVGK